MSKWQIKNLLGSITYGIRLELLETIEKLEVIFVRIEYYISKRKTNEIIVNSFEALIDHIADFWQNEAKLDIYPRKMATWLSDYLEWLGYPDFDYQTILNAIYNKIDKAEEEAFLAKTLDIKDPDVKAKIRKIDLDLPATNRTEFLSEEIDNLIEEIPTKIKSSIFYFDQDNKMHTFETENEIERQEKDVKKYSCTVSFENPLDVPLKDVMVNNIVPYGYKVKNYETIGFKTIDPAKKLLDDGLQLSWVIPEIQIKQEAKIKLNLERRISRTILMNIGDAVNILNTYFNIIPFEKNYTASDSFSNIQEIIDNLIIEDQIPKTFNLLEARPTDPYGLNLQKMELDQLIKWTYSPLEIGKSLKHTYLLSEHEFYVLNKFILKAESQDVPILEIVRITEPNIQFYEFLISFYIKLNDKIKEIYIKEKIPNNVNVTMQYPDSIEKSLEIIDDNIIQVWKIVPKIHKNQFEFGYICSGETVINEFPIELHIPELKIDLKNESSPQMEKRTFFLPELHYFLQKNRRFK